MHYVIYSGQKKIIGCTNIVICNSKFKQYQDSRLCWPE